MMASPHHHVFMSMILLSLAASAVAASPPTAVFAFGDSILDPGNNNGRDTINRADHYPYGIDFPNHRPTGRFSDGKILSDFIASDLGVKDLLPAYLDPNVCNHNLTTGVSFASAGMGLDDRTNRLTRAIDMDGQLHYFDEAVRRMENSVGSDEVKRIVSDAVYVISAGYNDMLFNVYMHPGWGRHDRNPFDDWFGHHHNHDYDHGDRTERPQDDPLAYHDDLLYKLESAIQRLYDAGARKIVILGLPPIGCFPMQVTASSLFPSNHWFQRNCDNDQNSDSESYNNVLQSHLSSLRSNLQGLEVSYADIYTPMMDMIQDPRNYGFDETSDGCCGTGVLLEVGPLCNEISSVCDDPSKYVFFDAVHTTEVANKYISNSIKQSMPANLN
ncbi:hypothetical protein MLD38_002684 [Melastoma candidum]|uniref:Uncharacterized protein n=1 Tax=Melastoma candidum TaxID=119954 RepID=A0ACB9S4J8_9MYRT|nr:hypothetical protein MLD38_002684 [Melastoma candidum]